MMIGNNQSVYFCLYFFDVSVDRKFSLKVLTFADHLLIQLNICILG